MRVTRTPDVAGAFVLVLLLLGTPCGAVESLLLGYRSLRLSACVPFWDGHPCMTNSPCRISTLVSLGMGLAAAPQCQHRPHQPHQNLK